ncbi:MAG: hypothetical protein QM742_07790 [Aquabacterium sp.]
MAAPPLTQEMLSPERFLEDVERLALLQQQPITVLKLVAYAADAMRVLMVLERHADMSDNFDDLLRAVCPDWRNPGSTDQPANLIAEVLQYSVNELTLIQKDMEQLMASERGTFKG